ncbi:MAG: oligosaccharide flippase family protein [Ruminococcus sp.]|nr:oligosaccharide flippase family protein [Ruminococcus sp.]
MANKEKSLVKNVLLFSIGNAGSKLLMLVIVPLYTYFVTAEQMGMYDVAHTYIGLFAPLAGMALYEGIYRWLLDDKGEKRKILKNGIFLTVIFVLIFDVIAAVVLWLVQYEFAVEFILVVDTTAAYTLAQFVTRGLRNNKIYALQGIIYTGTLILCNIIMVIWLKMQAQGLLLSIAAAGIVGTVYMLLVQRKGLRSEEKGTLDKRLSMDLVKYSVPMVPNNIAWWLVSASNRLVINWSLGNIANGVYAISMKFPTLVNMLSTFFYQAWQDQAITEYTSEQRDAYYTKIFNIYMKLLLSGIVALFPVTKFIIVYFMDASYHDAYKYIGLLYLSGVFNAFAAFYGTGYLSSKKTGGAFTTTIIGAVANVLLTFILIKPFGLYAAAIGNMVGNIAIWVVRMIQTRKHFRINLSYGIFALLIAVCLVSMILVNLANLPMMIILEVVLCVFFVIINKEMMKKLLGMLKSKAKK